MPCPGTVTSKYAFLCECSTTVSASAFQAEDESSNLFTRSVGKIKKTY